MFGWFSKKEQIDPKWQWAALGTYIAMLVVNGLAGSTTLLGGVDTATVSDNQPNLFAPAGLTFSIWGLIYALLGVFFFRVFAIWKTKKPRLSDNNMNQLLKLFTLSSILNAAWLFAWQYQVFWLSVVLMIGLLATLAVAHDVVTREKMGLSEMVAVRAPFSVYFGWITVATIANITTWLVSLGWRGGGIAEVTWMIVILLAGVAIAATTAWHRQDWMYLAVIIWAYYGIWFKHVSANGYDNQYPGVVMTLVILIIAVSALTGYLARIPFTARR